MKNRSLLSLLLLTTLLATMLLGLTQVPAIAQTQTNATNVVTVKLDGPLTPVWREILQRSITLATNQRSQVIVVELNTTGGSIDLMNELVQTILQSPVPVVVYVSPQGAMAASAGTLLTLSGKFSAMAPNTIIGAASPVGAQGEDIESTEATKVKEALKATVRTLAAQRGEKAITLAEEAIENAKAASAQEALDAGLVDFVATDLNDLLNQLDGQVVVVNGTSVTLQTRAATINETPITPVENVLALLTNPNIVFLLLAIAVQAILIEISHPGGWVAGFIGAVLLAVSIYGMNLLSVNYVGLILMGVAFVLFILDIKAPTHGALTVVGTATFIAGALVLFNSAQVPKFANVSVPLVITVGVLMGLSFFAIVMIAVRAMRAPIITGKESLIGKEGFVTSADKPGGIAQIAGEQWSILLAQGSAPLGKGDRVVVTEVRGLKLVVKKKE
jgi:membrane-bound serine protease (ClpP class)